MSEELLQRNLIKRPQKIGKWDFYNIGSTSIKALKEYGIIRNVDYRLFEKKKVDALVVQNKNVIAIIEYKKPSEFKSKKQKEAAIKQEIDVARILGSKIIIATDTKEAVWVNALTGKRIKDENGQEIVKVFNAEDEKIVDLLEKINNSINEQTNNIKPKQLVNPTDLAKSIWQDIWTVSGATPENCLYTFVELFIFKYLSDLGVLKGIHNFSNLVEGFNNNEAGEILENYANVIRPKIKELFPVNPLDKTTIINGTIFVSKDQKAVRGYSAVFKKVLLKFRDYGKLENIDYDFKSRLFESFLKESISKKNWGQFFTPLKVVRAIVEMAKDDVKDGVKICDPACGVGKFLLEPIASKLDYFYDITKKGITPKISIHGFDKGFDKDEQKTIILAKANMLIYFSSLIKENPGLTNQFAKLFNESFTLKTNSILGTLSEPITDEYDLILTNPPYVTSGSSNLKEEIKKDGELEDHYKINALGVEGLFMEWIIRALKPNGKAYIVIPDGILNRQHDKHLRKFIIEQCVIEGIISLPINTFFTTNKKTYILALTKKRDLKEKQKDPVFAYLVSEIGETRDVYRFDIAQNDLQEAVTLFTFFKNNKKHFFKINTDRRCKLINFSEFDKLYERTWVIDNYWTDKEKISLGILSQDKTFTLAEYSMLIGETSANLLELQNELDELNQKKKKKIQFSEYKVKDLFEAKLGNPKYTKNYCNRYKGSNPVYAASNNKPIGYINSFDFSGEHLTWARNGFAGFILPLEGNFSVNYDRGILVSKSKLINVKYIKYVLEPILRKIAVGRRDITGKDEFTKLYLSTIEDVIILLPINKNGEISLSDQEELIKEYEFISDLKITLLEYIEVINNSKIGFDYDTSNFKAVNIAKLFEIRKGNSKFTNKYINAHGGKYPLYSSQTSDDGILGLIDTFDFDEECLTWTTDGVHAGTVFLRDKKFSMTTHCGALLLKKEFKEQVHLKYIYYYLRNNLKGHAIGEQNRRVTLDIMENISIPVPFIGDRPDYRTQEELSQKYDKIEQIRKGFVSQISKLIGTNPILN